MTWGSVYKFPGGIKPVLSTQAVPLMLFPTLSSRWLTSLCTFSAGFA